MFKVLYLITRETAPCNANFHSAYLELISIRYKNLKTITQLARTSVYNVYKLSK